ncbi:hypothetical protein CRYUN_Cryun01aG0162500 [Craigia yunnanensis]
MNFLASGLNHTKIRKPVRVLPLPSASLSQAANGQSRTSKVESLADTNCFVVKGELDGHDAEMRKARTMKLPIVREDYLVECFKRQKKLPFDLYKVEAIGEASSMVTVRVKGRSAVHEASDCYVFRKGGRVGSEKIGGSKLEEMSKSDAISAIKCLFLEKTGNTWEAWEQKQNFQKQPGRFFPLDIFSFTCWNLSDYGVNKQISKNKHTDADSRLPPPLLELVKIILDCRAAMMEFEINMSEMPLGKLSKSNILNGFEVLTEIQNLLNCNAYDPSVKESLIIDASNRFFTVIPSVHPHVLRDEDDFKSKVQILEALQDIEISSRLVGFDVDSDDSLEEKYKKLNCDITPLPHDSEDFQLIEKYLLTTHAPTHTEWTLELEEVFSLERG